MIVLLGSKAIAAAKFKQENVEGEILPVSVLELVDTNTDTDINISEFLIRNGFAKTNVSDAIELEDCSTSSYCSPKPTTPFPSNPYFLPLEQHQPSHATPVEPPNVSPVSHQGNTLSSERFFQSLKSVSSEYYSEANLNVVPKTAKQCSSLNTIR